MILETYCPYCNSIGLKPIPVDYTLEEFVPDAYFCITCGRHHINYQIEKSVA
jgi:DNA-directed RNA polymerase subunit RPC12/RpoP